LIYQENLAALFLMTVSISWPLLPFVARSEIVSRRLIADFLTRIAPASRGAKLGRYRRRARSTAASSLSCDLVFKDRGRLVALSDQGSLVRSARNLGGRARRGTLTRFGVPSRIARERKCRLRWQPRQPFLVAFATSAVAEAASAPFANPRREAETTSAQKGRQA
jgi:hypothetical protein